jgi:spermidine synthase
MSQPLPAPLAENPSSDSTSSPFLPVLLVLFFGSGCAALIYEVIWYQMLELAIGSTTISVGVLLAAFMGGLCIGSIGLPRLRTQMHPLKMYALIEAGIAVFGLLVWLGIPLIDRLYIAANGLGLPNMLLRALVAAICLLPPTALMGASLPAAARWIESTRSGVSWWGLLYGTNTIGAVFGSLLAGFYLLRMYGVGAATLAAVAINLVVAAISLGVAARTPARNHVPDAAEAVADEGGLGSIYVTIGLSGASALGAEVVWTRLMGMMLGSTVYVFSIILAVFLIGLAIGSTVGAWISRTVRPRLALGWCQILLTLGIAWTAYMIAVSLPYWPIDPLLASSPWYTFQLDMARCLWAILPPAILWGASFPLALAAAAGPGQDPAKVVGKVYAANTLGAIIGALGVSLILVPMAGTQQAQRVLLAIAAVSAFTALMPYVRDQKSVGISGLLAASMVLALVLLVGLPAVPGELIAYGRRLPLNVGQSTILYTAEGRNSSVAISRWNSGEIYINVNGHVEATTEIYDMKLQRMVGHLPGLLHPNPKSVLGIGFGAGVSAGTFTRYPGIEHITICEIEPVIPPTSTRFFGKQNYEVMNNPKTHIVYDDARHYVMTTTNKYDIIASDPLDVFAKGTAALYSKEYFDAVKAHLNPGGYFSLYVPLYESDLRTVKSELATFFESFPNATVWANTRNGEGYDMVFMGQAEPLKINVDEIQKRLARPDYAPVAESLREVGVPSTLALFSTYTGRKADLGQWSAGSDINRDSNLRLSYLAGWGINSQLADVIYRDMLRFRQPPTDLFTGSPESVSELSGVFEAPSGFGVGTAPPR